MTEPNYEQEAQDLRALMLKTMELLVPGEEYDIEIILLPESQQYKFELNTQSKRAMVAWAEISFYIEERIEQELSGNENIGF